MAGNYFSITRVLVRRACVCVCVASFRSLSPLPRLFRDVQERSSLPLALDAFHLMLVLRLTDLSAGSLRQVHFNEQRTSVFSSLVSLKSNICVIFTLSDQMLLCMSRSDRYIVNRERRMATHAFVVTDDQMCSFVQISQGRSRLSISSRSATRSSNMYSNGF